MIVAQMAASTVLLACATLLAKTFIELRREPLGFQPDVTVATVTLPADAFGSGAERSAFYEQMEERLLARPGVRAVAAATVPPLVGGVPAAVNITSVDEPDAPRMSAQDITAGFFDTLGIPIVAGRAFARTDDSRAVPVVILNVRAASELFGDPRRAIGQRLRLDEEPWREVVGVVGDVRTTFFNTLEWRIEPLVYRPAAQAFSRVAPMATSFTMWVHVRGGPVLSAREVREAARGASPRASVIELRRARDLVAQATQQPALRTILLAGFCGVSLLLAALGVYGLVTRALTERVRDIAIRVALGAPRHQVVGTFVRGAVATAAAGLAVGIGLAMMLARTLEPMLYGVRATDAAPLAVTCALLLGITGLAAWLPARRAARMDAMRVLRT
jgi:predicted permease